MSEYWKWAKQRYVQKGLRCGDLVYIDSNYTAWKMKIKERSNAIAICALTPGNYGYVQVAPSKYRMVRVGIGRLVN